MDRTEPCAVSHRTSVWTELAQYVIPAAGVLWVSHIHLLPPDSSYTYKLYTSSVSLLLYIQQTLGTRMEAQKV